MHIKYQDLIGSIRAKPLNLNFGTPYIVEQNDSLYEIASRFNTTVEKLKELNNLKSDKLQPGEIIVVNDIYNPENDNIYLKYTVKKNDTIYSIAYNYGMTTDEVLEINNMLQGDIKAGETIFVYNNPPLLSDEALYTVKKGDTLYSIAKEYNTTVDKIKELNHLTNDFLTVNMKLIIKIESPETDKDTEIYTVVPGDSLYSISTKKGISVDELKKLNDLTSDELTVGHQLIIPKENHNGRDT